MSLSILEFGVSVSSGIHLQIVDSLFFLVMTFSFSQAFNAITKVSSQAYDSVRERVLPTPRKRRRDSEEKVAFESDWQRRRLEAGFLMRS